MDEDDVYGDIYMPSLREWLLIALWPGYADRWGKRCHERARQRAIRAYRREREAAWQAMADDIHSYMPDWVVPPLRWTD